MNNKILVIDDEKALCDTLKFNLELEGYDVDTANSAEEAMALDLAVYDLILLDVMMGEISGFQMAKILKNSPKLTSIPIIFCTALGEEEDMLKGLNIGADDYISKPYSIRNVLARVRTVLRRSGATQYKSSDTIRHEGLIINKELKSCEIDGIDIKLPRKEFEILWTFISNPGKIFSREEILQKIWPDDVVVLNRVVDVNVTRLRSKLGKYGHLIITRSGYGYGFQP